MMHACGHDGHTAIGLGLAHTLKQFESGLHGVIKLIFSLQRKVRVARGRWSMQVS
ncbi:putative amidohydrolase [Escherichia coli]|nr:putative amidohydrolase [Escherichia coli]